ncbi:MAG TPA: hypothetical protein VHA52_10935 [Candidatus Babeliaceae bacterium]|nr:hypothetical protein [Candidatus Babeliaceae bacterium]
MHIYRIFLVLTASSCCLLKSSTNLQEILNRYLETPSFTRQGAAQFFKKTYNQTVYGEQFLPRSFVHVLDFLRYGQKGKLPRTYGITIFDIFLTRLTQAKWVNPYALLELLQELPTLIAPWCSSDETQQKIALKQTLYDALLHRFSQLKEDPNQFLNETVDDLYIIMNNPNESSRIEFQYTLTRLLDSICNKLIFDPQDQDHIWNLLKEIAHHLENLLAIGGLPDTKTLNQLLWSVLERFCYCITLSSDIIKASTCQAIQEDLKNPTCSFLLIEEQERFMRSKRKRVTRALREIEVKAQAIDNS